ncbi:DUF1697 domain-containing protein [Pelomonas sp. Root1237]|uniref:DUF1697 domain-containing protein n=1 Tax=Pelomonas sp. Root1237 TaxID=1736434 RepID=UPI0006F1C76B|nr:DUF1697 domain-containing protein [Pelomonas sp. Root1237]KQV91872.1 hypothetical protein ASC91_04460 [Pelomonas sp. Root1237]
MRYVALWRGINVGKAKRLAMADLKALLTELGATKVSTLLNSGNAVFDVKKKLSADKIRTAVREQLGVDAAVILKTAAEWAAIAAGHGIDEADDPSRLLVAMTTDAAALQAAAAITAQGAERFVVTEHAAYLWCAHGILESKAAVALLKNLGEDCTTRNWATVEKLNALANG